MANVSIESGIILEENTKDLIGLDSGIVFHEENEANRKKQKIAISVTKPVPIHIPQIMNRGAWLRFVDAYLDDDEEGEFVPPHVVVAQRVAGTVMAFSVCTGNGRTLKGRDLSEVRNSILRMTGFLET